MLLRITQKWRSPAIREWWGLLAFALVLFAGRSAIADWNRIPSGSMEPSIYVGDLVLVNKLAYDLKVPFTTIHLATWGDPQRGDIVVFYRPDDQLRLIKRVIGTPGDVVAMEDNTLIINGEKTKYHAQTTDLPYQLIKEERGIATFATEDLLGKSHAVMALPLQMAMRSFGPITVPKGQFLMLGDNRDSSADSRYFGLVSRQKIVGKAERVLISWDKENFYRPRFKRFLYSLV